MTVVAFKDSIPPNEPNGTLVELLEEFLEEAKRGDLRAMAFATVRGNGSLGTGWDGTDGTGHQLASAIMVLQHRYAAGIYDDD